MTYLPETGEVVYRSKRNQATKRLWETFDAPAFIAAIARHIPSPRQHLVRYYGAYSNRARGERRKRASNESPSSSAETPLPTCQSYADFASECEAQTLELRSHTTRGDLSNRIQTPIRLLQAASRATQSKSSNCPATPCPASRARSGANSS